MGENNNEKFRSFMSRENIGKKLGHTALGFVLDEIRTLVSMASDSSHKVIIRKTAPSAFIGSSLFLQVRGTTINARMSSKFEQIGSWTAELAAFERLKKTIDCTL